MKILLVAATSVVLLGGCEMTALNQNASVANTTARSAPSEIRRGMTKEQVRAKFGRPRQANTMNGQSVWWYTNNRIDMLAAATGGLLGGGVELKSVKVTFNRSGRVSRVDVIEESSTL